nr:hypothetical protein [uncultured Enterobacter sp.]
MDDDIYYIAEEISQIDGVKGISVIDYVSRTIVHSIKVLEPHSSLTNAMSEIIRLNIKLGKLSDDRYRMEDILITYSDCIHLLKPLLKSERLFIHVSISRDANVALTRLRLNEKYCNFGA